MVKAKSNQIIREDEDGIKEADFGPATEETVFLVCNFVRVVPVNNTIQ